MNNAGLWIFFFLLLLVFLGLDLGVFNRHARIIRFREALAWSVFWVALSVTFGAGIYWRDGSEPGLQFFTSYLLEKSLSVDNIFLFALIFTRMGVAPEHQHRVLFWGVLGALITRGGFIVLGVQLVHHFHAVLYVFAVFLLIMGMRLLFERSRSFDPGRSRVTNLIRTVFAITDDAAGDRFLTRRGGHWRATPLLLVLILIEVVDVTFALDSLPAIFSVTQDAFIIFTSNILAILGLRSLYFVLARALVRFRYLHAALAVILMMIGARMLATHWLHIPTMWPLLAIVIILAVAILASVWAERQRSAAGING